MVLAVDDPVAFSTSSVAEVALSEAVVEAAGEGGRRAQVSLKMAPVIRNAVGEGRRLLGIVNAVCRITVPSSALPLALANLDDKSLPLMEQDISNRLISRNAAWLAKDLRVESMIGEIVPPTTSTTTVTFTDCPLNITCYGYNCVYCDWMFSNGHDCVRNEAPDGSCSCACDMPNGTTTRWPNVVASGTVGSRNLPSMTATCAALVILFMVACVDRSRL